MKTQILSALVLVLTTALTAFASEPSPRPSTWEGAGTVMDLKGNSIANYDLTVVKTSVGRDILTNVTVKLQDGKVIQQECSATPEEAGAWSETCDFGKGALRELGDGFAISYLIEGEKAFATTIVMDGTADLRLLRTELQNGKAIRFYREKLHKKD